MLLEHGGGGGGNQGGSSHCLASGNEYPKTVNVKLLHSGAIENASSAAFCPVLLSDLRPPQYSPAPASGDLNSHPVTQIVW